MVDIIRRLPQPPEGDVLNNIFPHFDRGDPMADWCLTEGEVDMLFTEFSAQLIHLFPVLDYPVETLGLYLSFLEERYMVMGCMPEDLLEEQQRTPGQPLIIIFHQDRLKGLQVRSTSLGGQPAPGGAPWEVQPMLSRGPEDLQSQPTPRYRASLANIRPEAASV